jgi:hypothetical protein
VEGGVRFHISFKRGQQAVIDALSGGRGGNIRVKTRSNNKLKSWAWPDLADHHKLRNLPLTRKRIKDAIDA